MIGRAIMAWIGPNTTDYTDEDRSFLVVTALRSETSQSVSSVLSVVFGPELTLEKALRDRPSTILGNLTRNEHHRSASRDDDMRQGLGPGDPLGMDAFQRQC